MLALSMSITLCMFGRTLTNCDILGLKKADLDIVLDTYPQLREQVIQMANRTRNCLQGSGCLVQTPLHKAETVRKDVVNNATFALNSTVIGSILSMDVDVIM